MLVITVQATMPVKETDDRTTAAMFFVASGFWDLKFHFGSVFKIMNLE